jgi:HPt (histidine-containing phosphotransfer) domain-containing protein
MTTPNELNEKVQVLWQKYLPQMLSRLQVVHAGVKELSRGNLTDQLRNEAAQEAHKLAGSLGTFGLQAGSELATEIEHLFSTPGTVSGPDLPKLKILVSKLQTEIESR